MSVSLAAAADGDTGSKIATAADNTLIFLILRALLSRRREPGAGTRLGIGVEGDVGDDGEDVSDGGEHVGRALDGQAADGDQRHRADPPLPLRHFLKALWRPLDRKSTRLNSST